MQRRVVGLEQPCRRTTLIDRNRRLLARAEAARVWKRQIIEEIALMLHVALLRTLHLQRGRTALLSEMIYLRRSLAAEEVNPPATLP